MVMKKLVFSLMFLFAAFLITSCSKDAVELIVGNWNVVSYKKNNVELLNTSPDFTNLKIEFNSNNSGTIYSNADTSNFNYLITNDTILKIETLDWTINNISADNMQITTTESSNTYVMKLEKQ